MRDRLGEMKAMEQDIVRLERELEERKLALQESRQSVNYFRKDMVRLQVTVEDIDSRETPRTCLLESARCYLVSAATYLLWYRA